MTLQRRILRSLELDEISAVDRPAVAGAVMEIAKSASPNPVTIAKLGGSLIQKARAARLRIPASEPKTQGELIVNKTEAHQELEKRARERVTKGREVNFAQAYVEECEADPMLAHRAISGEPDPALLKLAAERALKTAASQE